MDIQSMEIICECVLQMFNEHPEICPHRYEWMMTVSNKDGTWTHQYKCQLCGKVEKITNESEKGW